MFFFVQLWRDINQQVPTVQQRVQALSEAHAVVQVMKQHHLNMVDRAWVARTAKEPPTVRLGHVYVKGAVRRWKREV